MFGLGKTWKRFTLLALIVAGATAGVLVGSGVVHGSAQQAKKGPWRVVSPAPFELAPGATSVWTGKEMVVYGARATDLSVDGAAAYDPTADSWRRLARPPSTPNFCRRGAVWTGTEMLVWGCRQLAFDPATDHWRLLPPAPTGVAGGLVVWTGRELISWGGGCCGDSSSQGAAFNPDSDSWRRLASSPLAASQHAVGAWTGRELIMFVSGLDPDGKPIEGAARAAAYNPATDTWRRIAAPPELRTAAVWDGHEILLVGGSGGGYAYNPATNVWRRLPAAMSGGTQAVAAWTGRQLLVFGGETSPNRLLAYDPKHNAWTTLPKAPLRGRVAPTAVWTSHELILWGGVIGTPAGTSIPPKYLTDGAAFSGFRSSGTLRHLGCTTRTGPRTVAARSSSCPGRRSCRSSAAESSSRTTERPSARGTPNRSCAR
jgi:N-acetylneuraminic acid mutarotase